MSKYLHIHAQDSWHDDAFIVGDAEGLKALRDAIDQALAEKAGMAGVYCGDGEGFNAVVIKENYEPNFTQKLLMPYTGEIAKHGHMGETHPSDLISVELYGELDKQVWGKNET